MADEQEIVGDIEKLQLQTVIGFNGCVPGGLKVHPNGESLIYPLGCAVVVENISQGKPELLWGHTDDVSCIAVSNCSGNYLASGQRTHMGFKADVIVWDFNSRKLKYRLTLHTTKVQAVAFSKSDKYLASLGGKDDGSVVIWKLSDGSPICGSPAQVLSAGNTICLAFSQVDECKFVTGGDTTLRVWSLDVDSRKIRPTEVNMGNYKRIITCIQMADKVEEGDPFFFAGTTTGDILGINIKDTSIRLQHIGPEKNKFSLGVTAMAMLPTGDMLVGTGDGTVAIGTFCKKPPAPIKDIKRNVLVEYDFKVKKKWTDDNSKGRGNGVTSIALRGKGHNFFVGTENSQMYRFNLAEFTCDLIKTCHSKRVNDIIFPQHSSDLFVTCQEGEIRIWCISGHKINELKRVLVPNMTCTAVAMTSDGKALVSAWNDGKIRVYGFEIKQCKKTRKNEVEIVERAEIKDAHQKGVTAIACTHDDSDDFQIISGGGEGQVRIWRVKSQYSGMKGDKKYIYEQVAAMKEHKGSVSDIKVSHDDRQCVSASTDGTSILWDIQSKTRVQIVFSNTLFNCVCYDPEETQIITSGTDRKIAYWSCHSAEKVREVDGAKTGAVNAMDMCVGRKLFITGGEDKILKLWRYEEGDTIKVGIGHSGNICRAKIAPNNKQVISVSEDGALLLWNL